jgi:acyl-CoA thioesterase
MGGFNETLGIRPGDDATSVILDTQPEHEVGPGYIHFAVLSTVAEVAASRVTGAQVVPASVSLSLLLPAKAGRLVGRGKLLRRGKRLIVAEGDVYQADALVAKALVTFAVIG